MANTSVAGRQKSTNVRTGPSPLFRLAVKAASVVAPGWVEQRATEAFFRPRRVPRAAPGVVAGVAPSSFTFDSGGDQVAGYSWGEGRPVLLAHGWEGWAGQLQGFVEPLLARGFRPVAIDMPAHGASTGTEVTMMQMASALTRLARQVGPVAGVIAHSLGATATAHAVVGGLKADRLVLIAPAAESSYFARKAAQLIGLSAPQTEGMMERVQKKAGVRFESLELRDRVGSAKAPMLLMHDPDDRDVPYAHGEGIVKACAGAQLITLHGLGHRRMLKDPATLAQAVAFIAGG